MLVASSNISLEIIAVSGTYLSSAGVLDFMVVGGSGSASWSSFAVMHFRCL